MYSPDPVQQQQHAEGLAAFAAQTQHYLAGRVNASEFRAQRLRQGLCMRRHGPMLCMALPFGLLAASQLRMLASVARRWDRGYVNFNSHRQQVEFHWLRLADAPAMLMALASVQLQAVPAGGAGALQLACPPLAGITPDELLDPLPWCELLRQWAQQQQRAWLPCGFTVAVCGKPGDLGSCGPHELGLQALRHHGETGFAFSVGEACVHAFVPEAELLPRLQALLQVYQRHVQQQGGCQLRLSALVRQLGSEAFADEVQAQARCNRMAPDGAADQLSAALLARCAARFDAPKFPRVAAEAASMNAGHASFEPRFASWLSSHVLAQRPQGYAAVLLSPPRATAPGQLNADQLEALADLAERYGLGRLRLPRGKALLLVDVRHSALYPLWCELDLLGLAAPAASAPVDASAPAAQASPALQALRERVAELDHRFDLGELELDVPLRLLGADVAPQHWPDAIEQLLHTYLALRDGEAERFVDVLERLGPQAFQHPSWVVSMLTPVN